MKEGLWCCQQVHLDCFVYETRSLCYCCDPVPLHSGLLIRLPPHLKLQHVELDVVLIAGSIRIIWFHCDLYLHTLPPRPTVSGIWLITRSLLLACGLYIACAWCAGCVSQSGDGSTCTVLLSLQTEPFDSQLCRLPPAGPAERSPQLLLLLLRLLFMVLSM